MQSVTLDWLHLAVLIGAVQGFFLAIVLGTKQRNRTANRLLAIAVLAFSIQMISVVYHAVEFERVFPHFFGAAYPLPLLYGPLIFLYAVTTSDRTRHMRRWDALHLLPFAVVLFLGFPIYSMSGAEKIAFYQELQQGMRPPFVQVVDTVKFVSGISYAIATIVFLRRHRTRVEQSYSSLEGVTLQWLLMLAAGGAAVWILAALLHFSDVMQHPLIQRQDDIVALAIAILVYAIGYTALRQPEIFNVTTAEYRVPNLDLTGGGTDTAPAVMPQAEAELQATTPYARSGLSAKEASMLKEQLLQVMDSEYPYRRCDLTLTDLAARLSTTPHKLSEVLNSQLDQSFYDFVNGYRVREVQQRMADARTQNLTILSLALDAGFASKSTFNSVFKKQTGQTPSEYRFSLASESPTGG